MHYVWTSWVCVAVMVMYFWNTYTVAMARQRYQVTAPAVDGPPEFLCALRVQANTVEQMLFFLPSLLLCALWAGDKLAAVGGAVWVIGRVMYALAYLRDPASRGPGFMVALVAAVGLLLTAIAGMSGLSA
ncbi:MAPEG family protein [Undibacterium sp. SXout7W]|uniref:MAPEG family protein n=1 Tax=Undibacterium sp. SXout7W TaxID=3413049 RepID=UPI003BF2D464